MAKILLNHYDGRYSTRLLSDKEASELEASGGNVTHVDTRAYDAYLRHCEADVVWQTLWQALSNEQYYRRRESELMPLEEAQREIARLQDDLARSKRMEKFYEEQYTLQLGERHREAFVEYTCIFPQPGCNIDALPPEWHERAQEILEQYNSEQAASGLKAQGCCCGNAHKRLDEQAVAQLRNAGFLVEHDSETI